MFFIKFDFFFNFNNRFYFVSSCNYLKILQIIQIKLKIVQIIQIKLILLYLFIYK